MCRFLLKAGVYLSKNVPVLLEGALLACTSDGNLENG